MYLMFDDYHIIFSNSFTNERVFCIRNSEFKGFSVLETFDIQLIYIIKINIMIIEFPFELMFLSILLHFIYISEIKKFQCMLDCNLFIGSITT